MKSYLRVSEISLSCTLPGVRFYNLRTYQSLMISDNVEFLPSIFYAVFWQPFWKWQTSQKFWKRRIAPLMVTYHYVKFYVSIITGIHLEVININVRNFNFPIGFYSNPHTLWTPQNMTLTPFTTKLKTLGPTRNTYIYITPPSFMKFCPIVPEICHGQVHVPRKERKEENNNNNINNKKTEQKQ